jgi:glutamate decarboxylase
MQCRLVPVTKEGGYVMQPKDAIKFVDENTIGIFVILGSTYTGGFENVAEMSELCEYSHFFGAVMFHDGDAMGSDTNLCTSGRV